MSQLKQLFYFWIIFGFGDIFFGRPVQAVYYQHSNNHNAHPKRRLLSALTPSIDPDATARVQRDAQPDLLNNVPYPELYYLDQEDGSQMLIWPPEETLPRDVLARRPEVWLHTSLSTATATATATSLLLHFLEHYSRLGVAPERMIFTLHHNPAASDYVGRRLNVITNMLQAFEADYQLWIGDHSPAAAYRAMFQALSRIPIQDWILEVDSDEFLDFGKVPALQFLGKCERDGANWVTAQRVMRVPTTGALKQLPAFPFPLWAQYPLGCNIDTKDLVVAYRAFLRTTKRRQGIIQPEQAVNYLGVGGAWHKDAACEKTETASEQGINSSSKENDKMHDNLAVLSPYYTWWQYYRTKNMVGNAYLWTPRKAYSSGDSRATLHSLRLILYPSSSSSPSLDNNDGKCSSSSSSSSSSDNNNNITNISSIIKEALERESIDVQSLNAMCSPTAGPVELPLCREAAVALLAVQRRRAHEGS